MDGDYVQLVFVGWELSSNFKCLISFWSWFSLFSVLTERFITHLEIIHAAKKKNRSLWSLLVSLATYVSVTQNALNTAD